MQYHPVRTSDGMLNRYQALFSACFPTSEKFAPDTLRWLYADNPDGQAVGFDAMDNDFLAAHYVCIPTTIKLRGNPVRALLSLNTATHPNYRGQGLFTRLARMTYDTAAEQGFDCVYGVANANSTPGFTRKLGFQLVQPLEARIGFGSLGIDFDIAREKSSFRRIWTPDSLKWRCENPANPVRAKEASDRTGFYARTHISLISAYAELTDERYIPGPQPNSAGRPLKLYIGLTPDGSCRFPTYFRIPDRFRASPLNLIFKPLLDTHKELDPGTVYFTFLDFDAY